MPEADWDNEPDYYAWLNQGPDLDQGDEDPSDEHGNIWMDGAVPGGQEIAEVMLEILRKKGWQEAWADCDGLRICPRVRVWLDGYMDWDYEQVFLLRVWTDSEPHDDQGRTLTLTDHLAVYDSASGIKVEWRQDPRLFFDAAGEWTFAGRHWWIDWAEAMVEAQRASLPPIHSEIPARERVQARAMGLNLPYLQEEETANG